MPSSHLLLPLLLLSLSISASASAFISDDAAANQRRLLQQKKPCPVDFENQNYTIITSRCKGPDYSPEPCCSSFKEFACPLADQINDLTTDCATTMFTYITKVGQYPPGLFSGKCREGKDGLTCPAPPPSSSLNAAAPIAGSLVLMALLLILSLLFVV